MYGEGDYFGQPVRLLRFQKQFLYWLYEYSPATGERRFREAMLEVPKGNGKTPLSAWVMLFELLGPPLYGPKGSPVIPVAAASFEQADLLFGDMRICCTESPTLKHHVDAYDTEILVRNGPGRTYRVAAVAGTNDGPRPSGFAADEIHEWCLAADVQVSMADGTQRAASEVRAGDEVIAWDEATGAYVPGLVTEARSNGVRPLFEVTTRRGRSVLVTPTHRFYAERTVGTDPHTGCAVTERRWLRADELDAATDRAKVALGWDAKDTGDADRAYLLGVLAGDGSLSTESIGFTCADPLLLTEVGRLVAAYGCQVRASDGSGQRYRITRGRAGGGRNPLISMLREVGMWGHGCATKTVPDEVFAGGPAVWAAFLAGYLDTDGSVTRSGARQPHVRYVGASHRMLAQCQQLLAYLGIQSDLRARTDGRKASYLPTWELRIGGREQVRRFAELVMPRGVKADRLAAIAQVTAPAKLGGAASQARMFGFDRIKTVREVPPQETFGMTVAGYHTHVTNGLVTHNTGSKERVHLVIANGLAKRANSLVLNTTTPGSDLASMAGRKHLYGYRVNAGEVQDDRFLFVHYGVVDGAYDLEDEEQLRAAVLAANPAAGAFLRTEDVVARYHQIPEFEYRRYNLAQWTRADESWLPPGAWESCAGEVVIDPELPSYAAVDMAYKHDSVAVVVAQLDEDGKVRVQAKVWTAAKGQTYDVAAVDNHLRHLHRTLNMQAVAYDPAYFQRSAEALADEGLPMAEFPQGAGHMVPACQDSYRAIADGTLVHPDDPVLTDHVLAAATRDTDRGWRLSKGKSRRHIDGCIAMVMAVFLALPQIEQDKSLVPLFAWSED